MLSRFLHRRFHNHIHNRAYGRLHNPIRHWLPLVASLAVGLVGCTGQKGGPSVQRSVPLAPTVTFVRAGETMENATSGALILVTEGNGLVTVGGTFDSLTTEIKVLEDAQISVRLDATKNTFEFDAALANLEVRTFTLRALNSKSQFESGTANVTIKLNSSGTLLAFSTAGAVAAKTATGDTTIQLRGFSNLPMGAQGTLSDQGFSLTPGLPGFVSEASP